LLLGLDESDWVPAAILYHSKYASYASKLQAFYRDLERLSAVMWICGYGVNDRIERYSRLCSSIESDADLSAPGSPMQLTADETGGAMDVLAGNVYHISNKRKRTMILLRADSLLSSGEAVYAFPRITVEHVLPQTPPEGSEWLEWWPDDEERADATHRLGNLVLINKNQNSSAKNYPFTKKKSSYFTGRSGTSPFAITTNVLEQDRWTPEVFRERQQRLVNLLKSEWRLHEETAQPDKA